MAVVRLLRTSDRSASHTRLLLSHDDSRWGRFLCRALATLVGNYYDVLGLTPNASQAQIKAAYYRLSKKYHPDVATSVGDAKENFAKLSAAYEVLGNPRTRRMYDSGVVGSSAGSTASHTSSVDPEYEEFLRRRGTFRTRRSGEPPTGRSPMFDFDEFYRQHYGESIRRAQEDRASKAHKEEMEQLRVFERQRNMATFAVVALSVLASIIFKSKIR